MSLDPPGYILSLQNNIRARPISWEGAVRAKTITDADLKKIKAIDKVRKEQRKQTVEGDVSTYTTLLLGNNETKSIFESTAKRTDILNYMLVLTGDLMEDVPALTSRCLNLPFPTATRNNSSANPTKPGCLKIHGAGLRVRMDGGQVIRDVAEPEDVEVGAVRFPRRLVQELGLQGEGFLALAAGQCREFGFGVFGVEG
ncbi:hypothetical protein KC322_g10518 [Hortaea werneckii]|nr:hypothetical protein KC322_g10518 [Hortaea werneckii]